MLFPYNTLANELFVGRGERFLSLERKYEINFLNKATSWSKAKGGKEEPNRKA